MSERTARLRLALLGMHPDRVRSLLAERGSAAAVLRAIQSGQIDVRDTVRERLGDSGHLSSADVAAVAMREDLPAHIAGLPDAPDLLFVQGELPAAPGVAIVGTRRATGYGKRLAEVFGSSVARAGWVVVSGLARGIDGAAHQGCVAAGGVGVAVLGCGLDVMYPPEHAGLADRLIAGGGAVVSEYPPGTRPEPWRFPPRNRLISALAAVVIVVEAGEKGGALITAARAMEQGRTVLAVPGDVDRSSSRGCNLLIRDGAHPILDVDDLITSLTFVLGPVPAVPAKSVSDPILDLLGATGRSLEWITEQLEWSVPETLAHVGQLEGRGLVRLVDGVVLGSD